MSFVSHVAREILKASQDTIDDIRADVMVSAFLSPWETARAHIYESKPVTGTRFKHVVELIQETPGHLSYGRVNEHPYDKNITTVRAHSLHCRE